MACCNPCRAGEKVRICERCTKPFKPRARNQLYCPDCKPINDAEKCRERHRRRRERITKAVSVDGKQ